MKEAKYLLGLLLINAAYLLAVFFCGFAVKPVPLSFFQYGAFPLACFDVAAVVRFLFAGRLKKE